MYLRGMWADLWEYIKALFRHWKGFVTGSAVGLGLTVLTWRGIEFPDRSWGIVFLGGVAVAGFLAWREQYRRHPDPEIAQHIGRLIQLKETATHNILNAKMPDAESEASWKTEFNHWMTGLREVDRQWQDEVITALSNARATPGEVSRFTILGTYKPIFGVAPGHHEFKGMLAKRLSRLDELIRTLEQRNMA